jgi:NAD-dependent deacetylase
MIDKTIEILKQSRSLFILTGAGISAESGIPTFRGADGLWKNYSATDLATPEAFARNPKLVWEWYHWRQDIIRAAQPNPAHFAVTDLEDYYEKFLLLTQNVDNLHRRAGTKNVLELHGNIFRTRCCTCGVIADLDACQNPSAAIPVCPCGGMLRPDVVWFGEGIPHNVWQKSLEFVTAADTTIICGTSGVVWPAAAIPEFAQKSGGRTIEVNLEPTPISGLMDVTLCGKAGDILPRIVARLT